MEANSLFDYGKHTGKGCSWLPRDGAGRREGLGHPMAETLVGCSMGISVEGSSSRILCDAGFGGMGNSCIAITFPWSDRF